MTRYVAVFMGGPSHEHDVSLESGRVILTHLIQAGRSARAVVIERDGSFRLGPVANGAIPSDHLDAKSFRSAMSTSFSPALAPLEAVRRMVAEGLEAVFLATHGTAVEDGRLQGFLEWCGIPYTGADVQASVFAMNKCAFKTLLLSQGIPTAPFEVIASSEWLRSRSVLLERGMRAVGAPCVIKAADLGSSFGVRLVKDAGEVAAAIDEAASMATMVLWEKFIAGTEVTCGVFGRRDGELEVYPLVEIVPRKAAWFDYESKYEAGGADEICPARLAADATTRFQDLAKRVHRLIGVDGMSRTDAILANGEFNILETNTIPGMTRASLYPKAAAAAGLDLGRVAIKAIDLATARRSVIRTRVGVEDSNEAARG